MDSFRDLNAQVLGISIDHIACLQAWAESLGGISYPLLSDFWPHGAICNLYGVLRSQDGYSERAIFIVDANGIIRYIDIHPIDDRPDNDVLRQELEKIEAEDKAWGDGGSGAKAQRAVRTEMASGIYYEAPEEEEIPRGEIVLYCAHWCKDCRKARSWLDEHNLSYVEVDIDFNVAARRQVRAWSGGKLITPIIEFDGAVILDYDPARLEDALKKRLQ